MKCDKLGDESVDNFGLSEVEEESYDIAESSDLFDVVEPSVGDNANSSVKVLSENMASQNLVLSDSLPDFSKSKTKGRAKKVN